jgi:hypothetical protein
MAIALLHDHRQTFNEHFGGWQLTTFNGRKVII